MSERTLEDVLAQLDSYLEYPDNWDSYGADKVSPEAVVIAKQIVAHKDTKPLPHCAPLSSGGISLNWIAGETHLDCEVTPGGQIEVFAIGKEDDGAHFVIPAVVVRQEVKA